MKTKLVSLMVVMALLVSSMGTAIYAAEQPARLTVSEEYKLTEYETYFEFVPENDGFYFIYSTGEEDTYGYILKDSTSEHLTYDHLSGKGENFRLSVYLEAGESYTVYVKIYGSPSEFDVGVIAEPAVCEAVLREDVVHAVTDNWDFLCFVPERDGTYRFFSVEEDGKDESYWGIIYNSDYEQISVENDDLYSDNNFYVECDMVAGETYYLETVAHDEYRDISYSVQISEIMPISSLEIVPLDGTVAGINEDLHCELIINPDNHKSQEIEWYIEPERVGRIEYSGTWGASIELHSPGVAKVTAVTYSNGVSASDSYYVTCEGELPELETGVTVTDEMYDYEIRSYYFTAEEEGMYGILSRGKLDLKCSIYGMEDVDPIKTEGRKGAGENFNLQFYNSVPGTTYIVEVRFEHPDEYNTQFGEFELMAYTVTDEVDGLVMSSGDSCTVYTDADYYEFNVSLLPETANQSALEYVLWSLDGDDIGMNMLYGRNYVWYRFYASGTATLTATVSESSVGKEISASCVIESHEVGYKHIDLDEVKTVRTDGHYSEGWFVFTAEEDGAYTVYSTGNADVDVYMYTYGEDGYCEYSNYDDGYHYNFLCTVDLVAGQELVIECSVYDALEAEEYYVSVCKEYYADAITIVPDERNVYEVGETVSFYAMMGNGGATYYDHGLLMWSVLDTEVAVVDGGYSDELQVYLVGEGVTTVDVVTAEGYHDSFTIYVGTEPPVDPPEEEVILGDIDGDGRVSSMDSYAIKLIILNSIVSGSSESYNEAADINGDGKITAVDSLMLRKMVAGLI